MAVKRRVRRGEHQLGDETGKPMHISHMQASNAVDVLMKYCEQIYFATAGDMYPLSLSVMWLIRV